MVGTPYFPLGHAESIYKRQMWITEIDDVIATVAAAAVALAKMLPLAAWINN
jgi:hypothetical protein